MFTEMDKGMNEKPCYFHKIHPPNPTFTLTIATTDKDWEGFSDSKSNRWKWQPHQLILHINEKKLLTFLKNWKHFSCSKKQYHFSKNKATGSYINNIGISKETERRA